jgi:hypothetical protein
MKATLYYCLFAVVATVALVETRVLPNDVIDDPFEDLEYFIDDLMAEDEVISEGKLQN